MLDDLIEVYEFEELDEVKNNASALTLLNYSDEFEIENINYFQTDHFNETSFILLEGKCILYLAEVDGEDITKIIPFNMEKNKLFQLKKGAYYTLTLSIDAKVLMIDTKERLVKQKNITDETRQILTIFKHHLW